MNANSKTSSKKNNQPHLRRSALATASVLALGGFLGASAMAQSTTYDVTLPGGVQTLVTGAPATYTDWIKSQQDQSGVLGAVAGPIVNIGVTYTAATPPLVPTPINVNDNSVKALATGNLVPPNLVDLAALDHGVVRPGIIILSGQVDTGVVTATVNPGARIFIDETQLPAADMTLNRNTISATTTINEALNTVAGKVPVKDPAGSTQTGSISGSTDYAPLSVLSASGTSTTGTVNIVNQQAVLGAGTIAGSRAVVNAGTVDLQLRQSTTDITTALTVNNNSIAATYNGNIANNGFNAQAGSTDFTGSVALSNSQSTFDDAFGIYGPPAGSGATKSAFNTGSSVVADIRDRNGAETLLTGSLDLSSNAITAASTGNQAGTRTATGVAAGNQILFAAGGGANLDGYGSVTTNTLAVGGLVVTPALGADLALLSQQVNSATRLESEVLQGTISVTADNVGTGGAITANDNRVVSSSLGNIAGNRVDATTSNFNATVASGNLQINGGTAITALTNTGSVLVGVGLTNTATGNITANRNVLGAVAEGSVADSRVTLDTTNLTTLASGGAASTVGVDPQIGFYAHAAVANAGVTANNLQLNYGPASVISATVLDSLVNVSFSDQTNASGAINVTAGKVSVNSNLIQASAAGSNANTAVSLTAANTAVAQAAVGNAQFNENRVAAYVNSGSGFQIDAGTGFQIDAGNLSARTDFTLNANAVDASAVVNNATNSLRVAAGDVLTVGPNTFTTSSPSVTVNGTLATSDAAFGIASSQLNTAINTANNLGSAVVLVGTIGQSDVTASSNSTTAVSTGNQVANALTLSTGNVIATNAEAGPVAGISNVQTNTLAAGTVGNYVNGSTTPRTTGPVAFAYSDISVNFQGFAANSNLTTNNNLISANATGNSAARDSVTGLGGNTLLVTGTSLLSPAALQATGGVVSGAGALSVTNEFSLLNRQKDDVASNIQLTWDNPFGPQLLGRLAEVNGFTGIYGEPMNPIVALQNGIDVSHLTVNGNRTAAEVANNTAYNSVDLAFSNLTSGAGLLNQQDSTTAAGAKAAGIISVYAKDTATVNSELTVNNNAVVATANGSAATNVLRVAASNTLTGNASMAAAGDANTGGVVTADFGLVNNQSQTVGDVLAFSRGAIAVDLPGRETTALMRNSDATVKFNTVSATAQGTQAANTLILNTDSLNGASAALGSTQVTTSSVQANQGSVNATFLVSDAAVTGSNVTVSQNNALAKAGQNEATNNGYVLATNLTGRGARSTVLGANGSTGTAALATVSGTANTDFSVVNLQRGSTAVGGAVSAVAGGNLIASELITFTGTAAGKALSIDDNTVRAEGTFNRSSNNLVLASADALGNIVSAGTVNATAAVVNAQTSSGTGSALVDTTGVGTARAAALTDGAGNNLFAPVGMQTLTNADATVSRNKLQAQIDGNVASNALTVDASTSIAGSTPAVPTANLATYAVRNFQYNNATLDAKAIRADVGVFLEHVEVATVGTPLINGTLAGPIAGAIVTSNVTVSGNSVSAYGTANTETNRLNVKSAGSIGDATNPSTYAVQNGQVNDGAVTALVGGDARLSVVNPTGPWAGGLPGANVNIGIRAVDGISGSMAVTNNTMTALADGNTSIANEVLVSGGNTVYTPRYDVTTSQTNNGALTANVAGYGLTGPQADPGGVAVGIQAGLGISGQNTVSDNKFTAAVGGNTALSNLVNLVTDGTVNNPTLNVNNGQTNGAALVARVTNEAVGIVAGTNITEGSNSVDRNEQTAQGFGNTAGTNKINVSADNILGTPAVFGVTNTQDNTVLAPVTAEVLGGRIGITAAGTAPNGLITNAASTVSGNNLTSTAEANKVSSNAITVDAGNTILNALTPAATAPNYKVLNDQQNLASTSALVSNSRLGVNAATVTNLNASVSDNTLVAKAGGNWATSNKISVTAENTIGGSGFNATLNVDNQQNNLVSGVGGQSVSATVDGAAIGILNTGTFNNVNASVLSNQVVAYGYGNWASNAITLSQLTGNSSQATAGVSNQQMNSQSITSVVSNINIGLGGGLVAGASGGSSVVSGNSVTAQVVGNTAANRIMTK